MARVILVEDNERLAEQLGRVFRTAGIEMDHVIGVAAATHALAVHNYTVMVLDRGLPDGDGLVLLRQLRSRHLTIPVLVLTARDAIHDRINGLNDGADDYLTKPFSVEELVARVQALMRRVPVLQADDPTWGDLRLQLRGGVLHCGGEQVELAATEAQILDVLLRAEGATVRRQRLEQAAWGLGEAVTPGALDVTLHRLRRKLSRLGSSHIIRTHRGLGYAISPLHPPA